MRNEKDFFKWSFGLRFLFVFLCALMCVGNVWSTTTTRYPASDVDDTNWKALGSGAPTIGEQYYILWNDTNRVHDSKKDHDDLYISKHFLTTPTTSYDKVKSSGANTQNGEVSTSNWRYQFVTRYAAQAILFTLEAVPNETGKFYLKYGENNYVTDQWGKSSGTPTSDWNGSSNKLKFEYDSNKKGLKCTIGTSPKYFGAFVSSTVLNGQLQQLSATSPFVPVTFISKTVYDENTSVESHTVTYSMAIVNESGSAVSIEQGVITYHAESDDENNDNYPFNFVFQLGKAAEAYSTKETEHITLSIPHKSSPNDAYLDLPRGYNFLGWYKSTGSSTAVVSPSSSYVATFDNNYNIGARIEKKTKRPVTFASPNGTCSLIGVADKYKNAVTVSDVLSGNTLSVYKDDTLTLTATPDTQNGYYMYGWYYRVGSSTTREPLTPISTSTVGNVTTAKICVPTNASYVGADFRQKKAFQVASYSADFKNTDYVIRVNFNNTSRSDVNKSLSPTTTGATSFELYEGETVRLKFEYATSTTRGVHFNAWCYAVGTNVTILDHAFEYSNPIYDLDFNTLNAISGTPIFGVNVEKKATRNITFLVNPGGSYHASFMDANGNGDEHTSTTNSHGTFKVAKNAANDITESLYEDDKIRLERTNSGTGNDVSSLENGKLFRCWYWEDANGNRTYLEKGETSSYAHVDNRLDIVLPEEATRVGADIVTPTKSNITFVSSEHGSYSVKADTYNEVEVSTVNSTVAANSSNVVVNNLLMMGAVTLKTPVAATGYAFSRWYYTTSDGIKKTLASQSEEITVLLPGGTATVGAEFVQVGDFSVSGLYFTTLTDAIQAAQSEVSSNPSSTSTIIVARDATVPAGNYTIPAKVVLLIPYKAEQYTSGPVDRIATTDVPDKDHAYRKLTLANGAHLEVYGTIEVSGCQTTAQQRDVEISRPGGSGASYGLMQMDNGSSITLNDKSQLNAWGFIQGTGTIDARRGSSVREQFQINDWKTLITTCRMAAGGSINYQLHVLPINQYFIQNVEVKAKYHPGSRLFGQVSANVIGMKLAFNDVGIIGVKYSDKEKEEAQKQHIELKDDVAVFLMDNADNSEDTWVCKWYDVENDQQVYDVNNSAYLGSLAMEINFAENGINIDLSAFGYGDIEGIDVDSRDFALPLTNNFKIHLKSGNLVVTQNTILLPGAVIEIDKKSTMTIAEDTVWNAKLNNNAGGWEYKPQTLYLYDANQWGKYVTTGVNDGGAFTTIFDAFNNYDLLFDYGSRVKFRPGGVPNVRDISSPAGLGDAQLIVHGTVDVKGYLKTTYGDKKSTHISSTSYDTTTPSETDGGAIISTVADAGTIIFSKKAQSAAETNVNNRNNFLWQVDKAKTDDYVRYVGSHVIPAWLKNEAGSTYSEADGFTETADAPAGKSFCFIDIDGDGKGEWVSLTNDGCFVYDGTDYYAKPKEYVALANGKTPNEDHTYSDAAGQGRLFILVDDCQWWEVEKKDNLYHCTNPDNDTYYYWDSYGEGQWREKEFQVYWKNWDGSSLRWDGTTEETMYQNHLVYNLNYGIIPKYLEDENPTRPDDVDYTYNFTGWTPEIDSVKGDATYTAVYEAIQKKYTIIFNDADGNEIERQQLALGASPEPPTISNPLAYWDPAIATVSGNTTYTLKTYDEEPDEFTVTWRNYDGSEIYHETVGADDTPAYNKTTAIGKTGVDAEGTPVKDLGNEYNYTFTGWSPTIVEATANAAYTATFSVEQKKYAINFYDENGNQLGSTQNLAFGADPVAPEYTNPSPEAGYTYSLQWIDMYDPSIAGVNVPTVTRAANYQADFIATINKYTVTLLSGTDTACTFVGAGLYDYNAADDALTIRVNPNVGYKFVKWQMFDGEEYVDTDKARSFTTAITADMTYRAIVEPQTDLVVDVTDVTDVKKPQEVDNLILSSNGSESGQLLHSDRLTVNGNCYFDLAINAKNHQWYAVAVPWQVDAENGISVNGRTLELGKDFDIIYYDGARRASEGKQKCWKYVEDDDNKTLVPGRLYMIGLMGDAPVIRFAKKAGAAILTTSTSVTAYAQTTGVNTDAGWNGVANPALFHAFVNPGVTYGQVYKSDTRDYDPITLSDAKFVVGQGAFVSVDADKAITVSKDAPFSPASAPRNTRTSNVKYEVRLAPAEANYTSRLYIETTDDKETDEYIVGQDLAKIGVSSLVPQMWINRYNEKLCVNTQELQNEKAEYPLGISVPANGEYTISNVNVNVNEDYTLYLTLNNEAIWNLSDAPYTLDLTKGTTNAYGLRISAKAPQVVTGVDEAVVDAKGETKKVLINNQVFIIRGNQVYSIDGQLVIR